MNKTEELNALNKRLAELLDWEWQGYALEETSYDEILMDEYETPKKYFDPSTDKAQAMELLKDLCKKYIVLINDTGDFVEIEILKQFQDSEKSIFNVEGNTLEEAVVRAVIKMLESENG